MARARAGRVCHVTADRAVVRDRYVHPDDRDDTPATAAQLEELRTMPRDRHLNTPEEVRDAADARGGHVSPTKLGWMIVGPKGTYTLGASFGDPRARENAITGLRRHAGIDVTEPLPDDREPAVTEAPPDKLVIEGRPRTGLSYSIGDPPPTPAADRPDQSVTVSREDHETLLKMTEEQAEEIAGLRTRLSELAARVDGHDTRLAELGKATDGQSQAMTRLRRQAAEQGRLLAELAAAAPDDAPPAAPPDPDAEDRAKLTEWLAALPAGLRVGTRTIRDNLGMDGPVARRLVRQMVEAGALLQHGKNTQGGDPPTYSRPAPDPPPDPEGDQT